MHGCMDTWTRGHMDAWIHGRSDGCLCACTCRQPHMHKINTHICMRNHAGLYTLEVSVIVALLKVTGASRLCRCRRHIENIIALIVILHGLSCPSLVWISFVFSWFSSDPVRFGAAPFCSQSGLAVHVLRHTRNIRTICKHKSTN